MSAIAKQLAELEITPKRGEDRQDFLNRAVKEVAGLKDADWDGLDQETQDWYNAAADAKNAKAKTLPDFPDLAPPEEEKSSTRRRSAAKEDEPEAKTPGTKTIDPGKVKVKMAVKVVTKRGKELSGTVVEIDKEILVLKMGNGDEEELGIDRINVIYTLDTDSGGDEPADPIKVGSTVVLTTKRGKTVTGKIVELDEELVVLKTDDGEEEFARDRVESIKAAAAGKSDAKDEPKTTRRGEAKDEPKDEGKTKRSTNEGVSVGQRIKELIADDLSATADDIGKMLKKEGLEFRENTLKLNYADAHKFIDILKAKKLLKA